MSHTQHLIFICSYTHLSLTLTHSTLMYFTLANLFLIPNIFYPPSLAYNHSLLLFLSLVTRRYSHLLSVWLFFNPLTLLTIRISSFSSCILTSMLISSATSCTMWVPFCTIYLFCHPSYISAIFSFSCKMPPFRLCFCFQLLITIYTPPTISGLFPRRPTTSKAWHILCPLYLPNPDLSSSFCQISSASHTHFAFLLDH